MKYLVCITIVLATLLTSTVVATAQNSVYTMDSSTASYSSPFGNGGTVTVDYVLSSGNAVAGIGNSFQVVFNYSDFSQGENVPDGANHLWYAAATDIPTANHIGVSINYASFFGNTGPNTDDPFLPALNKPEDPWNRTPIWSGTSPDAWMRDRLSNGMIDLLGTFSVSTNAISTPTGYAIVDDQLELGGRLNITFDNDFIYQGVWTTPQGTVASTQFGNRTGIVNSSHGETVVFDYTAFRTDDAGAYSQTDRGFWTATGSVTFAPVPEPSGVLLIGLTGVLGLLRRRRTERTRKTGPEEI